MYNEHIFASHNAQPLTEPCYCTWLGAHIEKSSIHFTPQMFNGTVFDYTICFLFYTIIRFCLVTWNICTFFLFYFICLSRMNLWDYSQLLHWKPFSKSFGHLKLIRYFWSSRWTVFCYTIKFIEFKLSHRNVTFKRNNSTYSSKCWKGDICFVSESSWGDVNQCHFPCIKNASGVERWLA